MGKFQPLFIMGVILLGFSVNAHADLVPDGRGGLKYPLGDFNDNGIRAWRGLDGRITQEYVASMDKSLHVRSAVTGARSTGTVVATVEASVSRSTVLKNVLSKAVVGGRAALGATNAIGWAILALQAYEMVSPILAKEDYRFNKDEGTFGKTLPAGAKPCITATDCTKQAVIDGAAQVYPEGTDPNAACKDFVNSNDVFLHSGIEGVWKNEQYIMGGFCVTSTGPGGGQLIAGRVGVYYDEYFEPITQSEFDRIVGPGADANPTPYVNVTADASGNIPGLSTSDEVKVESGTVAQTSPYTNPHTGQVEQARWDFSTDPQGKTVVKETTTPRPDLQPNSAEAPKPDGEGQTGSDTKTDDKPKEDEKPKEEESGLCKLFPDILACDKQPEAGEEPDLTLPEKVISVEYTLPSVFDVTAQCPAPVSFDVSIMGESKTFAYTFDHVCSVAAQLRYFLIAMAWVIAAFFCLKTVRES